jgi:hypothetical protein
MRVVGENATRAAFPLLDMALAEMDLDEIPPRSWEVEREEFIRRLEDDA